MPRNRPAPVQVQEYRAVFEALDNAIIEDGPNEPAENEVEEVPEPEPVIIQTQTGNSLYWSNRLNRWLVVGLPEEEQIAPPPRINAAIRVEPLWIPEQRLPEQRLPEQRLKDFEIKLKPRAKSMYFEDLSNHEKIDVMKREFVNLLKAVFDNPESLKSYVTNKSLSKEQAKLIFKNLNKFNVNKCPCCRKFDQRLLTTPIGKELEPLIDIAQTTARSRSY